MKEVSSPIRM